MAARWIRFLLLFIFIFVAPLQASEITDVRPILSTGGCAGEDQSVFHSEDMSLDLGSLRLHETLKLSGELPPSSEAPVSVMASKRSSVNSPPPRRRKRIAISVLCSAILPGLGELYLYRESRDAYTLARVPVFFALEGYLWYGYYHNHTKGKDLKDEYMAFGDTHWSLERFLAQHPCCEDLGGCDDWQYYNEHCQGEFNFFLFTPREADEEEYYENIGKYNAFVYGWDDWNDQPDFWTPNRRYYWSLREDSDEHLVRGDQHLMFLIVNRVVSMLDAAWLAYRMGTNEEPEEGWSLELKPDRSITWLNLCYRF